MKKSSLLIVLIMAFALCAFALSANAQEVSSVDPQFGAVESLDGAGEGSSELVKLACNDHFHTYPSSYIVTEDKSLTFDFALVSANGCGVTYAKANIVAFEMPESVTTMAGELFQSHTSIKYFKISKSFTGFGGNNTFDGSSLEWFDFNGNTNIKELKQSTFCGCKSLKGICLPDQITTIGVYCFANCPSLGPVYLPASVTKFNGDYGWPTFAPPGGQEGGGRVFNRNMYFVNEKFDDPAKAEKPTVYYMPSEITSIWNCGFRGMSNMNDIIVFSEKTVNFDTGYDLIFNNMCTSSDKEKTIVFLGDVTKLRLYENLNNVNFVFANSNDAGIDSFTFKYLARVSNDTAATKLGKMYFCSTGSVYELNGSVSASQMRHFSDERKSVSMDAASCDLNATADTYCYCGVSTGVKEIAGTALGHNFNVDKGAKLVGFDYADYMSEGFRCIECARCDAVDKSVTAESVIYGFKGYSVSTFSNGITMGFSINKGIIDEIKLLDENAQLGFVAAVSFILDGNSPVNSDGEALQLSAGRVVKVDLIGIEGYSKMTNAEINLVGDMWDVYVDADGDGERETCVKDVEFVLCGYIYAMGEVRYFGENGTTSWAQGTTYSQLSEQ